AGEVVVLVGARVPALSELIHPEGALLLGLPGPSRAAAARIVAALEVLHEAASDRDLVVEGAVGVLEVVEVGVEPLVVLEEGADVLRPVLDVGDEIGPELADLSRDIVDEALVGGAVWSFDDDEEGGPATDPTELLLERDEARAVAG